MGQPESFFAPFALAAKDLGPFAALTGIGAGLQSLAAGGSFMGGGGGILGDLFSGFNPGMSAGGEGLNLSGYGSAFDSGAGLSGVDYVNQLQPGQLARGLTDAQISQDPFLQGLMGPAATTPGMTQDGQFNLDNPPGGFEGTVFPAFVPSERK